MGVKTTPVGKVLWLGLLSEEYWITIIMVSILAMALILIISIVANEVKRKINKNFEKKKKKSTRIVTGP